MRFELLSSHPLPASAATICRIPALGAHWRVIVECWPASGEWQGRLVFEPEPPAPLHEPRIGPTTLRAATQAGVLDAAFELPERRIRELLHSLG